MSKKEKQETKEEIKEEEKTENETTVEEMPKSEDANAKYFEMENKYLRLLAELENTRKRLQKEKLYVIQISF